jgi:predicted RNase H-like HicB family nuclease
MDSSNRFLPQAIVYRRSNARLTLAMKTLQDYTLVIRPETNGAFVAYVPAIPGCHAWGRTSEDARTEIVNVFDMIQEEYQEENRTLPLDVELVVAHAS